MNYICISILSCLLAFATGAHCSQPVVNGEELPTFSSYDQGYSLQLPKDWQQATCMFFSPPPSQNPEDSTQVVMTVCTKEFDNSITLTLEQLYNAALDEFSAIQTTFPDTNTRVEDMGSEEINGVPCAWFLHSSKWDSLGNKGLQYFFVHQGKFCKITFTASSAAFDEYLPEFQRIAHSFSIHEKAQQNN